jgi:hypothetical protein
MSDTSQGPGWWLASDGKWYPPELWTGPLSARPAGAPYGATPYTAAPSGSPPTYGATPYSATPSYAPGTAYTPYAPYGQGAQSKTNGLAIAALVCGIAGFLFFIPAGLGIIFGFVSRAQIKNSGGRQKGEGMAIAGIIVGFAWLVVLVLVIVFGNHNNNNVNDVVNPAGLPLQLLLGGHAN